jgi:hypothetical protein
MAFCTIISASFSGGCVAVLVPSIIIHPLCVATMKFSCCSFIFGSSYFAVVSGFSSFLPSSVKKRTITTTSVAERPFTSTQIYQYATAPEGLVNVADIWSERDVYSMEQWATQYGMQKADGVELYSEDGGNDYSLMTNSGVWLVKLFFGCLPPL